MSICVRLSELEVQVGSFVYTFEEPDEADAFQECEAVMNLHYCEAKHPCVSKRSVGEILRGPTHHS
jgi:hypothetical protein